MTVRVCQSKRLIEILLVDTPSGRDDLAGIEAVSREYKLWVELPESLRREELDFVGGCIQICFVHDQILVKTLQPVDHSSREDNV